METDYRKLCKELFGTDDEEQLRHIAEAYRKKNARNAGRKKKFTEEEVKRMAQLRDHGVGLQKIADEFGTSRQVVGRYLSKAVILIWAPRLIARAADNTAIYDMRVSTTSSLHDGSGIAGTYLPNTAKVVISMSAISKSLHMTRTTLYTPSYTGLILSSFSNIIPTFF